MSSKVNIVKAIRQSERNSYWFILPYVIFFLLFVAYPLVFSFILIFHRWNIVTPMEWVGMKNFQRLSSDPQFFRAMFNTFIFLLIHIPLQIVVALGFSLLLHSRGMFRGFFRAVYFLPVVVSGSLSQPLAKPVFVRLRSAEFSFECFRHTESTLAY